MKKLLVFLIITIFHLSTIIAQDFYKIQWNKVEEQEIIGNTKTANKLVEAIIKKAKEEKNDIQFIKSLFYRSKFTMNLEENSAEVIHDMISAEINNVDNVSNSILLSILADFQSQYLQKNAYRIQDRTNTENDTSNFQFWSVEKFNSEIIPNYQKSLKEKEVLKNTNIADYSYLLDTVDIPTIPFSNTYQLLANRALNYAKSTNYYLTKSSESFKITKKYLIPANKFIAIDLGSSSLFNKDYLALKLYQELEKSLFQNKKYELLAYFSLDRYKYIKSKIPISESQFLEALEDLENRFKNPLAKNLI